MSGGSLPVRGGLVLAMDRFNRILLIDRDNLMAKVGPAVITARFQEEVEKIGLFYPPDPASADVSTIGGNVAECAGGLRGLKYGVTRDYVMGLTVVLPNGEIIKTGGDTVKGVAGYDLTRLIIGDHVHYPPPDTQTRDKEDHDGLLQGDVKGRGDRGRDYP